jgi:hypothetical protein
MGLNVSKAFFKANSVLNQNLGKFDSLNIIGINQSGTQVYLVQGITKGFYYKEASGAEGDTREILNIVPENSTVETALKNVALFELVNLDGTFIRFEPMSKKLPERPSFQWTFSIKPNREAKKVI